MALVQTSPVVGQGCHLCRLNELKSETPCAHAEKRECWACCGAEKRMFSRVSSVATFRQKSMLSRLVWERRKATAFFETRFSLDGVMPRS